MNPEKSAPPPSQSEGFDGEEFRRQVEREDRKARVFDGQGRFHPSNCTDSEMKELAAIARRPPPGLLLYKFGSRSVVGGYDLKSGSAVCLKYYFPKHFYKHLTYGMGGSRCSGSWLAALAFGRAGIPTPAPLAFIEMKKFGGIWLEQAFLATRQAKGTSLNDFSATHRDDPGRLERVAANLREHFSTMAGHWIVHGDLKATNILVAENEQVSFVDLDSAKVLTSSSRWRDLRARDERIFAQNWRNEPALAAIFRIAFAT